LGAQADGVQAQPATCTQALMPAPPRSERFYGYVLRCGLVRDFRG